MPTKRAFKGATLLITRSPVASPAPSPRWPPLPSPLSSSRLVIPYPNPQSQTPSPALSTFSLLRTPTTSYFSAFAPRPSTPSISNTSFETQGALGLIGVHIPSNMTNVSDTLKASMAERRLSPLDALIEDACGGSTADELEEGEFTEDPWLHSLFRARSAFRALRDAQRELDHFFTDNADLFERLDRLSDQIVSFQIALDYFYRDAQTKWWAQVPEPPGSAQEVLAFAQSLSMDPVSDDLVDVISDLSERMTFDARKLQEATRDLSTQHHDLMYPTNDWQDDEVSFHVPRKIALLSRPPMDDYDLRRIPQFNFP